MTVAVLLTQLALAVVQPPEASGCDPAACLQQIRSRVPTVAVAPATEGDLRGVWSRGGGLAGEVLYLFADASYLATDWSDVGLAERVYDKGHWALLQGAVHLTPDAGWEAIRNKDRRYLPLSTDGQAGYLLLGSDVALGFFETLAATQRDITPEDWLSAAAFKRRRTFRDSDTERLKASLLRGRVVPPRQPKP